MRNKPNALRIEWRVHCPLKTITPFQQRHCSLTQANHMGFMSSAAAGSHRSLEPPLKDTFHGVADPHHCTCAVSGTEARTDSSTRRRNSCALVVTAVSLYVCRDTEHDKCHELLSGITSHHRAARHACPTRIPHDALTSVTFIRLFWCGLPALYAASSLAAMRSIESLSCRASG